MSTAIQKHQPGTLQIKTQRAADMLLVLQEEGEVRALVRQFVKEQMVEGTDYGIIPGTKDTTLLKPGSEKLFDLFRCRPEYEFIERTVDVGAGLYAYEIRCKAVGRETGTVINEGMGSASSYESRYRYRNGERTCPRCAKATIIKGKEEYGGGWVCFAKKGGCGAKWGDDAPEITGQQVGKVTNPDLADVANTVLKIAKKRAQVDCAIGLARVSDLFTQDLEDLPTVTVSEPPTPAAKLVQAVTTYVAPTTSNVTITATVEPPQPEKDDDADEVPQDRALRDAILAAGSLGQLVLTLPAIKKLPPPLDAQVMDSYKARRDALKAGK
jgi:hypothetical protein